MRGKDAVTVVDLLCNLRYDNGKGNSRKASGFQRRGREGLNVKFAKERVRNRSLR